MVELGIAHIGLRPPDAQRLKITVGMVTVAGSASKGWRMSALNQADLVVIAPDDSAAQAALDNRAAYPRAAFAALVGEADVVPPGCLRLAWPIRTDHVIHLLKTVEALREAPSPPTPAAADSDVLKLASLLRSVTDERDPNVTWKVRGTPDHSVYIVPVARKFFYRPALPRLRAMPLNVALTFERIGSNAVPGGVNPRPLVVLQWLVGSLTGPLGMLPWIEPGTALRMRRWPDFPVLYHDPRHRRIAALLSERVSPVTDLMHLTRLDSATVTGFVNAANLCGYVVPVAAGAAATIRQMGDGSRRSLFERLRGALGIAEA